MQALGLGVGQRSGSSEGTDGPVGGDFDLGFTQGNGQLLGLFESGLLLLDVVRVCVGLAGGGGELVVIPGKGFIWIDFACVYKGVEINEGVLKGCFPAFDGGFGGGDAL